MNRRSLGRRDFIVAGSTSVLGACGWDGAKGVRLAVSRFNDRVSEALVSHDRLAPKYRPSERSSSFPNYHISMSTPTVDDLNTWRLRVDGLVSRPTEFTVSDLRALGRLSYTVKHHCVEGWTAIATWDGTPVRDLAAEVGLLPEARYVRFDSFDAGYYNGWDLKSAMHPETILAWGFNEDVLMPNHGAPVRLYAPHKLGYKLTKYLTSVTFTAERPGGYWEDRGYPWFGGV